MSQAEIPATMRAVVTLGHGGIDQLEYREDWPTPIAAPGEVLIEVGACGLNNTDINTRSGWYAKSVREGTTVTGGTQGFIQTGDDGGWGESIQFPRIQGADVCGRVAALGEGVSRELLDQRVMIETWIRDWNNPDNIEKCRYFGSECDGGYAEYTTVDAHNVHSIESPLSDAELATFATSWVTAENMLDRATVATGDVVLVTGASGGVGTALIQLIRRRSATPVALCSESKANQLRDIGADAILPREPHDLPAALDQAIGRPSVDVIADVVGGALWPQLIDVLCQGGRYTCAGAIAGPMVEFDLRAFYLNDLTFTGATVIPRGLFARLVGYIERGEVSPVLAATYPLRDLASAQKAFLTKQHVGNIVAIVRDQNRM
jgi:NADPH:quinone reductase-like Zn-dependent oxidoreductase